MGMSDCIKCWDSPCCCGYEYRNWSKDVRLSQAAVILGIDERSLEKHLGDMLPEDHPRKGEK